MGFFGLFDSTKTSSTSNTTNVDSRAAATDQGIVLQPGSAFGGGGGGGGTTVAGTSGSNLVTGQHGIVANSSNVASLGGVQGNSSNIAANGSIQLQGGSRLEISSDPAVIAAALAAEGDNTSMFAGTLKDLFASQAATADNQNANTAALINGQSDQQQNFLDKFSKVVGDLASNAQTGGDTSRNKIVLYMAVGLLLLVGVIFWRRA